MRALAAALLLSSALAHADGRLAEATMERRVARHLFVGRIVYPSQRLTWVLYRGGDRARLEVFCQEGDRQPTKGIRLDGRELDEAYWQEPVVVRYAGTRTAARTPTYELRLEEGAPAVGKSRCANAPAAVTLTCAPAKLKVRPAGAVLVPGQGADPESTPPPKWQPAPSRTITALRCQAPGDLSLFGVLAEHPAAFAPATETSPGVEWADENSDQVVQTGAYRAIR